MPVDIREWIDNSVSELRESPSSGLLTAAYAAYLGCWHTVTTRMQPGVNVFDRDWDVLVILDACRVDALREVAEEYGFLNEISSMPSVGSSSHEWMAHTFTSEYLEEIGRTAYTNPNGFSELCFVDGTYPPRREVPFGSHRWDVVDAADFGLLDITWQIGHDEDLGIVPPGFMTDRTIQLCRETSFDRYIVHYYQPHQPYIAGSIRENRRPTAVESNPWTALREGRTDRDEVWALYLDNLRLVLDHVELLLENVDADTVAITADHGDALGEYGVYGHPEGIPHPATRHVPWTETSATDENTYHPDVATEFDADLDARASTDQTDADVLEQLANLGYK